MPVIENKLKLTNINIKTRRINTEHGDAVKMLPLIRRSKKRFKNNPGPNLL